MKRAGGAAVALGTVMLLFGCAKQLSSGGALGLGEEPYQVGPLTVWVRPQPEVERLCRLRYPAISRDRLVHGCYVPESETIITVADPYVLLHELKHHFEGAWHPAEWAAPAAGR